MKKTNLLRTMVLALGLLASMGAWAEEYTIGEAKTWVFGGLSGTDAKSSVTAINSEYYVRANSSRTFTLTTCTDKELTFADGTTTNTGTYYWKANGSLNGTAPSATLTAGSGTDAGMPSFAFNTNVAGTVYVKVRQEGSGDAATFRIYFADGTNLDYVQYSGASRNSNTTIDEIAYTAPKGGSFFITSAGNGAWGVYGVRFVPASSAINTETTWKFDKCVNLAAPSSSGNNSTEINGLYHRWVYARYFNYATSESQNFAFSDGENITVTSKATANAAGSVSNNSTITNASTSASDVTPFMAFNASVPGTCYALMSVESSKYSRIYFTDHVDDTGVSAVTGKYSSVTGNGSLQEVKYSSIEAGSFFVGSPNAAATIYAVRFVPESVTTPTIRNNNGTITITAGVSSVGATVKTYYTTDGSTPTAESTEYTAPFSQATAATIKAITISQSSASTASAVTDPKSIPAIPSALSSTTLSFAGLGTSDVTCDDESNYTIDTEKKTYTTNSANASALYIKDVSFCYSTNGRVITLGANYLILNGAPVTITIPGLTAGHIVTLSSSSNNTSAVTFNCSSGGTIISGNTNSIQTTPTNIVIKSTGGDMVLTTASAGLRLYSITVTDGIVLTETNGLTPYSGVKNAEVKMSFSRTFANGKASTVCLPFDMTAPATSVGTFATFTGVNNEMTEVTMSAVAEGATLTAGTPYLFTPATADEITFSNTAYTVPEGGFTAASTVDQDSWHFKGTYENLTWDDGQTVLYGLAGNAFTPTSGSVNIGDFVRFNSGSTAAFRAYMYYGITAPTHHAAPILPDRMKVVLVGLNGETTHIGSIPVVDESGEWYSIDGCRLNGKPSAKGLYINGGRKVIIK